MIRMSNNHNVPQLAFGMYKVSPEETEKVVLQAIRAGYRHFDTASFYQNEEGLGKALKKSGLPREEFFVCSKVWNDAQKLGRKGVRESFEKTLQNLQCNYLDLYLVHWPVPGYHTETYKEMELFVKEGKLKNIGISNYTPLVRLFKCLCFFLYRVGYKESTIVSYCESDFLKDRFSCQLLFCFVLFCFAF